MDVAAPEEEIPAGDEIFKDFPGEGEEQEAEAADQDDEEKPKVDPFANTELED